MSLLFGSIVGFSLGLTGGGGAIFAVPLLVYGLAVRPHDAAGISLAAVGATAAAGALQRLHAGEIDLRTGLLFSITGVLGAPAGTALGGLLPDTLLLVLFAGLMGYVALRMWRQSENGRASDGPGEAAAKAEAACDSPCARDEGGRLVYNRRCAVIMGATGLATGLLAGIFGVGGGFVIVPALILVTGMEIRRAVATSLMVITLVSASGVVSHLLAGDPPDPRITALFVAGGVCGMGLGTLTGRRLSGPVLQRVFAVVIFFVAGFVVVRSVLL